MMHIKDALDEAFEAMAETPHRLPVLNREPRVQMDGRKWHLIQERDGHRCRICGVLVPTGTGEIDHIMPRSSFAAQRIPVADRPDNLQTACVPCNQAKSNYAPIFLNRMVGVTSACWDCLTPSQEESYYDHPPAPVMTVPDYCGRCGHTWVPDESWIL